METILITRAQFEHFLRNAQVGMGEPWEALKKYVEQDRLEQISTAWKNCEDKDPSGLVTFPALLRELGLV
jgi:hypothetical protein